jgi:cobalt-zinc-cadmium efflux system outer membrane protein
MSLRHIRLGLSNRTAAPVLAALAAAAILSASGCASPRPAATGPEARPLGRDIAAYEAPPEPELPPGDASALGAPASGTSGSGPFAPGPSTPDLAAPASADPWEPTGELTLPEALSLALQHSPRLAAASWDLRAAEAQVLQARLAPNPELELELEEFGGSGPRRGVEAAELSLRLSQVIELGGKRAARTRLAGAAGSLSGWDYEAERLTVLTEATLGFIDVLVGQERLGLADEFLELARQTRDGVDERVKAGRVSPLELTKASIELANVRIEWNRARNELKAARQRLATTWGGLQPRFASARGRLDTVAEIPSQESLDLLIRRNPDVARWAQEMEHRLAALSVERSGRIPDLTLSVGARRFFETDDQAAMVGLALPVPLFDRRQGSVREAGYRLAQAGWRAREAEARTVAVLAESYAALASARTEALSLQQEIVPAAQQVFAAAREGYRQGKFGYLEVLDAQRTLFETRARLLEALGRYHRAMATVESLVGTPLDALAEPAPAPTEDQP